MRRREKEIVLETAAEMKREVEMIKSQNEAEPNEHRKRKKRTKATTEQKKWKETKLIGNIKQKDLKNLI